MAGTQTQTDSLESLGLPQQTDIEGGGFSTVAVVGGGTMGKGLAQAIAAKVLGAGA